MKYVAAVIFLASCAMLTPAPVADRAMGQSVPVINPEDNSEVAAEVDPAQSERRPENRNSKLKSSPLAIALIAPTPSAPEISSCANLDAGDLKETIKAKLDCITDNTK